MRPAPWGHLLDWIRDQTAPIRPGQDENGGPSRASPLDANWINLGTIRAWRDHKCTEYPKFGSSPTWLIDVRKDCLVSPAQLRGEARYCALSYVWGQVETGKLTTGTREAFCRPGAFSASSPSPVVIPKTIRHAMGLVKELGERYLWVDSLCIVQDQDTGHELANMGAIYDRATLTIVAATAWDADGGLRGLRGISGPRHLSAVGDDMSEYLDRDSMIWVCVNHSLLQTYPANTPENSRAWTFQEGQFSRRMLIFCDQTVIWKCLCRCTDEVGTDLAAQGSRGSPRQPLAPRRGKSGPTPRGLVRRVLPDPCLPLQHSKLYPYRRLSPGLSRNRSRAGKNRCPSDFVFSGVLLGPANRLSPSCPDVVCGRAESPTP